MRCVVGLMWVVVEKVVGIDLGIINLVVVVMEGGKFIIVMNVEG